MPRLPLGDLEEARRDPRAYRNKLDAPAEKRFGNTYVGALRQAIFRYHRVREREEAMRYLQNRLLHPRLKNSRRKSETLDQLDWYIDEFTGRGWPMFQTGLRVTVPLSLEFPPDLICSGEVSRVDVVPTGGYAAWMFRSRAGSAWSDELQMPILQHILASRILGVPLSEIRIGIYAFQEQRVDSVCYSQAEIEEAWMALEDLMVRLGF